MNAESELQLPYKGPRTYLHGTDIYNAVCELLAASGRSDLAKIDLVFHQVSKSQLRTAIFQGAAPEESHPNVVFRCQEQGENIIVHLEETGKPVTGRVPYDEEGLVSAAEIDTDERRISLASREGYSNIEMFVALNKKLLSHLFPEVRGKWFFTRLQLARSIYKLPLERLEVRFLGHSNFRITRSTLLGNGEALGSIYFSLVPAE